MVPPPLSRFPDIRKNRCWSRPLRVRQWSVSRRPKRLICALGAPKNHCRGNKRPQESLGWSNDPIWQSNWLLTINFCAQATPFHCATRAPHSDNTFLSSNLPSTCCYRRCSEKYYTKKVSVVTVSFSGKNAENKLAKLRNYPNLKKSSEISSTEDYRSIVRDRLPYLILNPSELVYFTVLTRLSAAAIGRLLGGLLLRYIRFLFNMETVENRRIMFI